VPYLQGVGKWLHVPIIFLINIQLTVVYWLISYIKLLTFHHCNGSVLNATTGFRRYSSSSSLSRLSPELKIPKKSF
jgi:hypothetical protein